MYRTKFLSNNMIKLIKLIAKREGFTTLALSKSQLRFSTHKLSALCNIIRGNQTQAADDNPSYVDHIYQQWLRAPLTVHPAWAAYFRKNSYICPPRVDGLSETLDEQIILEHQALTSIITSYQARGHLVADLDPLSIKKPKEIMHFDGVARRANEEVLRHSADYFFSKKDMDREFMLPITTYIGGDQQSLKLSEIFNRLESVYCNKIGLEFMHMDTVSIDWVKKQFEPPGAMNLTAEERRLCLRRLKRSNEFEAFLAKKYQSEKRFGLEGCDMMIPSLKTIIDVSTLNGVDKFVMGMAHRGRLNVLANVCRKPLEHIFTQFAGLKAIDEGSGDVKYHLGTNVKRLNRFTNKQVNLIVVANPSHLEAVNPVIQGRARAEQFYRGDGNGNTVLSIQIHGDASFCGQGIVFETIQLANLPAYTTHGTIHYIVNNQIGFTTDPRFSRSSKYCSDVGRVVNAPIFHVNADDPDAVIHVSKVAANYRAKFKKDVVIDLVGYRRNGHNEADEPAFTQPLMYKIIRKHKPIFHLYADQLVAEGVMKRQEVNEAVKGYTKIMEDAFQKAKKYKSIRYRDWIDSPWSGFFEGKDTYVTKPTGVKEETLLHIATKFSEEPDREQFKIHPGIQRILKARQALVKQRVIDWALGEALAIGSLLKDGIHVRLSGEDVERGTFSHRHHVLHDQEVDKLTYNALEHMYPDQATYLVSNSALSEYSILGFEHGYSMANPKSLVIFEGQFGDFLNTAQVVIDTFICSGESKWARQSGMVMLLPHASEGMGPEHTSSRLERYLQLCDDDPDTFPKKCDNYATKQLKEINWIIANLTKPANLFHILRRQIALPFRKPLVIMSPKSLLRHPLARSKFCEMVEGTEFQRLIPDENYEAVDPMCVHKLVFCSGHTYYDLFMARADRRLEKKVAIVRLEQICPFPYDLVMQTLDRYKNAEIIWAQEDHKNQGGWAYVQPRMRTTIINSRDPDREVEYRGRPCSASTATGNKKQFVTEQHDYIVSIFGELTDEDKERHKKAKEAIAAVGKVASDKNKTKTANNDKGKGKAAQGPTNKSKTKSINFTLPWKKMSDVKKSKDNNDKQKK